MTRLSPKDLSAYSPWLLLGIVAFGAGDALAANGIKVGEGRLHPFVDLETRLDSAAGYFDQSSGADAAPEAVAHVRPGLRLEVDSKAAAVNFIGDVDYVAYTGLLNRGSERASRLDGHISFDAAFNRTGAVELRLADQFARSDTTRNVAVGLGVISLFNRANVALPIHPGGGALEVTPSGAYTVEFFEPMPGGTILCGDPSCDVGAISRMNYQNYQAGLAARWRFLPKTALVLETTFDTRSYFETGAESPTPYLFKAAFGLSGLLSSRVALIAKAGWGHDFADPPPTGSGGSTVHGQLELSYMLSEASTFRFGYLRALEPVPVYGTYVDDRGYVDLQLLLAGERLLLQARGAFDYLSYYRQSNRNDTTISVSAGPTYHFTPWLAGALGYVLGIRSSTLAGSNLNFPRHEGFLRLTLTY